MTTADFANEIKKAKENPSCLDVMVGSILAVALMPVNIAWSAYSAGKICVWYMPLFGLVPLTFTQLVGVFMALVIVKLYVNPIKLNDIKDGYNKSVTGAAISAAVNNFIIFASIIFVGWIFAPSNHPAPPAPAQVEASK